MKSDDLKSFCMMGICNYQFLLLLAKKSNTFDYMDSMLAKIVADMFKSNEKILAVFVLGSAASGNMRPDSDIDLAVLPEGGEKLEAVDRIGISNSLSFELSRTVDLGEISSENLVYAREALLKGYPVYLKDEERMNLARANLLGMYIQYNLDRKEVLDAYTA